MKKRPKLLHTAGHQNAGTEAQPEVPRGQYFISAFPMPPVVLEPSLRLLSIVVLHF